MPGTAESDPPSARRGDPWQPLHVVVPLRSLSGGKARLGGALDAEEREALILGMARRTLAVLEEWPACRRVAVVTPDATLLGAVAGGPSDRTAGRQTGKVVPRLQLGEGLNEAIVQARAAAIEEGAAGLLVLPGDLPDLSVEALERLWLAGDAALAASRGGALVAIAPSDARAGTNALLLRPPAVIEPAFGPGSFEAHLRAAAAAGAAVQVVADAGLGFDLDTPDDLERLDPERFRELTALGLGAGESVEA